MELTEDQTTNLGKYFLDISKLIVGIYVFTSFPDKLLVSFWGLICAAIFLLGGLILLKGGQK
ncbi:MAG TPA: hypothetical protein DE315_07125 [Candidatus Omnitrophica bacterium]|nr:hypothetical protein [Candidatus Omnitrophota bacterium]HCI45283.1 hypothetical protein [Candidatus Omnitrophota bacterium]